MAKDILGMFGPERSIRSAGSNQGRDKRDVMNYKAPQGPTSINDPKAPGLHGNNFDYCGTQERGSLHSESSGSPGIGGHSGCCPQGKH